ncbi:uncharacterized protein LOC117582511 isoform X2 [Drosophila guanche]|uniref:uncharacterized protein LOC117582511 isoform X2 n=1 Tax=Drosophila guanche TaxID=7266 RepID=UPI001470B366|nr:uncharacterized protein LOC117582511 isoform X2 [Drosophila guanche]
MTKDRNDAAKSVGQPPVFAGCMPLEEITIYDWMRQQNCKTTRYQQVETYPNIRPPISRCNKQQTLRWMSDSLEATGCERLFDMRKDNVLEAWTNIPNKETLGWYGLSGGIQDPEAVLFNQALTKSLQAASGVKAKLPKQLKPQWKPKPKPTGAYVLNRQCLRSQLARMPTIKRKLSPNYAFTWLHCPPPDPTSPPFEDKRGPPIPLTSALGMERTPRKHGKRKHSLRHPMCHLSCDQPKNQCTDYEWRKYKEDPRAIDEAFRREQAAAQTSTEEEPKDYDELYARMLGCFEQSRDQNTICQDYEKCCKAPGDPPTQGCGEMVPEGADGGAGGKSDGDGGGGGGGTDGKDGDGKYGDGKDGDGKDRDGKDRDGKKGKKGGRKNKKRGGEGGDGDGDGKDTVKDCPCELCNYCDKESDTPLIREMRRRDKQRQQREYLQLMRHRQYVKCRTAEYLATQHKCDPIVCCNKFCGNPLLQDHLAKIDAVQQLQQQLKRCNRKNRVSCTSIHRRLNRLKQHLCEAFEMPEKS